MELLLAGANSLSATMRVLALHRTDAARRPEEPAPVKASCHMASFSELRMAAPLGVRTGNCDPRQMGPPIAGVLQRDVMPLAVLPLRQPAQLPSF